MLAIKVVPWAAEPSVYYFGSGTKPPVALLFLLGVLGRVLPGPGGAAVISAAGTAAGELVHRLVVLLALWAMVQGASLAGGCALVGGGAVAAAVEGTLWQSLIMCSPRTWLAVARLRKCCRC